LYVSGKRIDRSILQGESIELFRAAIKNPATRDPYERRLMSFLKTMNMAPDEFINLAKKDASVTERKIISFISSLNLRAEKREITPATVGNSLKAVRLLLEMNDVSLNWKKIRRVLPKARRYAIDRIPTIDEMKEIIEAADQRGKALTLVFASSGIREGAIEDLKISDYTTIKREQKVVAGRLIVYNGDPERYVTFISPEACEALDKYLEFRKEHGENVKNTSPLFRDKFDPIKGLYGHGKKGSKEIVIPMTAPAVRQYYNRLLFSIGIRNERKRRHDFSVHGFRKFFKTKSELGGMRPINVETLMGHSTAISDSYYRPTEKELLEDYLKCVDHLAIMMESRLQIEVKEEINQMQEHDAINTDAITTLSDQVAKLMQEIQILKQQK
jgi:integrase